MHTSLQTLTRQWIRAKNTARPSPNSAAAREDDLQGNAWHLVGQLSNSEDLTSEPLSVLTVEDLRVERLREAFADFAIRTLQHQFAERSPPWRGFCKWLWSEQGLLPENPIDRIEGPRSIPVAPKAAWRRRPRPGCGRGERTIATGATAVA